MYTYIYSKLKRRLQNYSGILIVPNSTTHTQKKPVQLVASIITRCVSDSTRVVSQNTRGYTIHIQTAGRGQRTRGACVIKRLCAVLCARSRRAHTQRETRAPFVAKPAHDRTRMRARCAHTKAGARISIKSVRVRATG